MIVWSCSASHYLYKAHYRKLIYIYMCIPMDAYWRKANKSSFILRFFLFYRGYYCCCFCRHRRCCHGVVIALAASVCSSYVTFFLFLFSCSRVHMHEVSKSFDNEIIDFGRKMIFLRLTHIIYSLGYVDEFCAEEIYDLAYFKNGFMRSFSFLMLEKILRGSVWRRFF